MSESPDPTLMPSDEIVEPTSADTDPTPETPTTTPIATPPPDRREAIAIAELCQLGGCPERTAEFLAEGLTEADVRRVLLAARAEGQTPDIRSTIHPDAHTAHHASPEHNPLIKAVKHLTGKE